MHGVMAAPGVRIGGEVDRHLLEAAEHDDVLDQTGAPMRRM